MENAKKFLFNLYVASIHKFIGQSDRYNYVCIHIIVDFLSGYVNIMQLRIKQGEMGVRI